MRQVRRLDLIWQGSEIEQYERLKEDAVAYSKPIPEFVKEIIERALKKKSI